ncbi:MAG: glycoside hydrolase family 3 protein [Gammaproteobacteria bacterium]|nr:glycoside hydrolase family 3 protein [Gammaproteobacteria bacterium]MBT5203791.1 glycoside hydrolase family 3 protein [Gammaproteobacteria bacterium]MBT5600605.1 glycoside hydrolase family 3 protein [Gammaproteobacteria bacterium]
MQIDGLQFRDLDHDGLLSPFEDWRLSASQRAEDLVRRLNLSEKAGLLLHGTLPSVAGAMSSLGIGSEYDLQVSEELILQRGVNCMITRLVTSPRDLAVQNNEIQSIAAQGRFGIPVTISTDPRHHFNDVLGASVSSSGFSQWPGTLGLAAIRDVETVRRFGDIVRQEYRATGISMALSPQADLATSPRWARIDGTFGEDPGLVRSLVGAYIDGVQGGANGLTDQSIAAVIKHWVGYGAAENGFDGHNFYGRFSSFPGGAFQTHVDAFLSAFEMQVAGVMPTYNILKELVLDGAMIEQVGAGYSVELLQDRLRGQHGFQGLILSDWAIARDVNDACRLGEPPMQPTDISMAWGVEDLTVSERYAKGLNAGLDQFGGEDTPGPILQAVQAGLVSEERIDESAQRVLEQKFMLGLFDKPFVDVDTAACTVGNSGFVAEAELAQRRSMVYLKRPETNLDKQAKYYLYGFSKQAFEAADLAIVDDLELATMAIIKLQSPSQILHPGFFFGARQKEGDLDFKETDESYQAFQNIAREVPTIVVVEMNRPPILTNIEDKSNVLIATFGVSDEAIIEVLSDPALAIGRLPYALPASMDHVLGQSPDVPFDDPNPLFVSGYVADA